MGRTKLLPSQDLHYVSYRKGKPVILLHGFGANNYSWRHLVSKVPPGYQTLAFDLKGFGKSPKPDDRKYSLCDQANLICQFILTNDLKGVTLIGHSMGGGVSLIVAAKLEKMKEARLSSMVLIDSIAYRQRLPFFLSILQVPVIGPLTAALLAAELQVQTVLKLAYHDHNKISKKDINAYATTLKLPGSINALVSSARQIEPDNVEEVAEKYANINIPTLIIWGRQDKIVPFAVGERLHKTIPRSCMVVIENCGHIPHEECAAETIPIIVDFLSHNLDN